MGGSGDRASDDGASNDGAPNDGASKDAGRPPADAASDGRAARSGGRLLDSDTVVRRLGGWQVMGSLADPPATAGDDGTRLAQPPASPAASPPAPSRSTGIGAGRVLPLCWTAGAAAECERLHAIIAAVGEDAATRFAAALMRLMVRLTIDGIDAREGDTVEVALLPPLAVRVRVAREAIIVVGLSPLPPIG